MKICVVVPQIEDFYFTPHRGSFIGAHIVKDILILLGHEVELFVFPIWGRRAKKISLPKELFYLKDYLVLDEIGPISFFTFYKRFGPSYEEASNIILSKKPDIIFISCFAFCYAKQTILFAHALRAKDKHIQIVCGGAGVSVFPEYFENTGLFDTVLTGEAEQVIPEFFHKPVFNFLCPQVVETRSTKKVKYFSTYISRGCPKACGFCSVSLIHGKKLRVIDRPKFISKIKSVFSNLEPYEKVFLNFEDDNILLKKDFFIELLNYIHLRYPKIRFSCENGMDYRELDDVLLKKLISIGFRQFNFSIGNLNKNISKVQGRKVELKKLKEISEILNFYAIPTIVYFISGFIGEDIEQAIENLLFLAGLGENIRVGLSLFYPVPGILGFENKDIFFNKSPVLCCGSSAWPWNNSLTTQDMITLFRLVRLTNLIKKRVLDSVEKELLQKCIREKRLYTMVKGNSHFIEVPNYNKYMVKMLLNEIKF